MSQKRRWIFGLLAASAWLLLSPIGGLAGGSLTAIVDPESYDFGDVAVGNTSAVVTVTVTNASDSAEFVTVTTSSVRFTLVSTDCLRVLQPGDSCSADVAAQVFSPGPDQGSVNFFLNSANFGEQVWADLFVNGV